MVLPSSRGASPPPRRRPSFLDPPRSVTPLAAPEIRKALGLALLLLLLVVFGLLFADRTPRGLDRLFAGSREQPGAEPAPTSAPSLEALREERARLLPTLFEGSLLGVVDRTDFSETEKYRRLLEILWASPAEEVSRRVTGMLDYETALRDPDLLRGEFVRVRGLVAQLEAERLRAPLAGRTDVYRGWLSDTDASKPVVFDVPDPPEALELKSDVVDVEGIFYRIVRYETKHGKFQEVPHLLGRTLRVTDLGRGRASVPVLFPVLLVLALGVAVGIMFRSRRRRGAPPPGRADFRGMFERKLREEGRSPE